MEGFPDTSQDDAIALLEASIAAFLRREADPFGSGSAWIACREFGLFSLLGSAPDSLGFSLSAYARLLASISRLSGRLAFAVAQTNQARLLAAGGGRAAEGALEAVALDSLSRGPGNDPHALRFESALPPGAPDVLWVGRTPNGHADLPRAISSTCIDELRLMPLVQGSALYVFTVHPESLEKAERIDLDEAARQGLAVKQVLDTMAISHGQLWRGFELVLAFCDERLVFNRRLVQFQNIRAVLASTYARLRALSAVISAACANLQVDAVDRLEVLAAIHRRASLRLAGDLMQAFGGTAFMEDSGMPEIYSNVIKLSIGSEWFAAPGRIARTEWLAGQAAVWIGGLMARADVGSRDFWSTYAQRAIDEVPDALGRLLELAGLCLALEHIGAKDDECGGSLRDYLEHEVRESAMAVRHGTFPYVAAQ